jgi:hypothetical protein
MKPTYLPTLPSLYVVQILLLFKFDDFKSFIPKLGMVLVVLLLEGKKAWNQPTYPPSLFMWSKYCYYSSLFDDLKSFFSL